MLDLENISNTLLTFIKDAFIMMNGLENNN